MKAICLFFLLLVFACSSQPVDNQDTLIKISNEILGNLVEEKFTDVRSDFNGKMLNALSMEQIEALWKGLVSQFGSYTSAGETLSDKIEEYRVVYTILKFEKSPLKLKVVFDQDDKVAGLFLIPVNAK